MLNWVMDELGYTPLGYECIESANKSSRGRISCGRIRSRINWIVDSSNRARGKIEVLIWSNPSITIMDDYGHVFTMARSYS